MNPDEFVVPPMKKSCLLLKLFFNTKSSSSAEFIIAGCHPYLSSIHKNRKCCQSYLVIRVLYDLFNFIISSTIVLIMEGMKHIYIILMQFAILWNLLKLIGSQCNTVSVLPNIWQMNKFKKVSLCIIMIRNQVCF